MFIFSQNTEMSESFNLLPHGEGVQRINFIDRIGARYEMFDNSGGRDNEGIIMINFVRTTTLFDWVQVASAWADGLGLSQHLKLGPALWLVENIRL
jgi:hypothetical protein